jgi:hypothetical protein
MATIDKEHYDMLPNGKMKGFVICKRGDKYIIRCKPEKSNRPPTGAQIENRKRFGQQSRERFRQSD